MNTELQTFEIDGKSLQEIMYKDVRVVTSRQIADLHRKKVKSVNQTFTRNMERFEKDKDYYEVTRSDLITDNMNMSVFFSKTSNTKDTYLFAEKGYFKLCKIFNDNVSWDVYEKLLDVYFRYKEMKNYECVEDLIVLQAQSLKKLRLKVESIDNRLEKVEYNYEERKSLLPSPEKSDRDNFNQLVRKYASNNNKKYYEVYNMVYSEALYRLKIKFNTRAKNENISTIDWIDQNGYMDKVLAIALDMLE